MPRTLGIDYGFKRIGLALSDPSKMLASPLATVETRKKLMETAKLLAQTAQEHGVDEIVIGYPYKLSGAAGTMTDEIDLLINEMEPLVEAKIVKWDERMTTLMAERSLKEGNMNRKKRAKVVDQVAALLILQSYLDKVGDEPPTTRYAPF